MNVRKEIIINASINEVRVAITENRELAEFFIELQDKERIVGNIYLGKVKRIVQGLNAAFVDVGQRHDAFLHFSDLDESLEKTVIVDETDDDDEPPTVTRSNVALRKVNPIKNKKNLASFYTKKTGEFKINLKEGQDVIVQVTREAYHNKGVKVTSKIAVPGQYVVLLPFDKMIGISKKIQQYPERKRLRQMTRNVLPEGFGCIIRTAAQGKSEDELQRDWDNLFEKWNEIVSNIEKYDSPYLVYQDMSLASSIIRDLFTKDVQRVVIDSKKLYKETTAYLKWASPHLVEKIEYHGEKRHIFERFGIDKSLATTYLRKVFLPSGGSIVIDHTEAMTVIDVNSGRSTENIQEKNSLKTNIEAAREIAKQLRFRDLGGIIVIDFIDMQFENNRKKIFFEMKNELANDRAKTVVYPVTQLGLIQITRQRINQNIAEKISEECPMCHGIGRVTSKEVLLNSIERWLKKFRAGSSEFRIILHVHPKIAAFLTEGHISKLSKLMMKYFVKIKLQQSDHIPIDQYKFFSVRYQKFITNDFD